MEASFRQASAFLTLTTSSLVVRRLSLMLRRTSLMPRGTSSAITLELSQQTSLPPRVFLPVACPEIRCHGIPGRDIDTFLRLSRFTRQPPHLARTHPGSNRRTPATKQLLRRSNHHARALPIGPILLIFMLLGIMKEMFTSFAGLVGIFNDNFNTNEALINSKEVVINTNGGIGNANQVVLLPI